MIIIGYQGIGKSTLAARKRGYIDLESSCFWYNGKRPEDWYIYYCQVAENLSKQGYKVFTSSHKVVYDFLKKSREMVFIVCPSVSLKDEWINRLEDRYNKDKSDKNYKAFMNAKDRYEDNIKELKSSGIHCAEITEMDYDLDVFVSNTAYKLEMKG